MVKKMNEAVRCFNEDIRDRKSTARSAKNRVIGSRSKKCTLPSDYLTPSQRKKLNGKVETYNMDIPMTWIEFKNLRIEYQERYLNKLIQTYDVGPARLAQMFGITSAPMGQYIKKHFPQLKTPGVGKKMSKDQIKKWEEFLTFGKKPEDNKKTSVEESEPINEIAHVNSTVVEPMSIHSFSIGYNGNIILNEVTKYLTSVLGDVVHGQLQITYTNN